MINKLFSSMHELLDYIIEHYCEADEQQREQYCSAVGEIKTSIDELLDQYVTLEEKLSQFFELYRELEEQTEDQSNVTAHADKQLSSKDELSFAEAQSYNAVRSRQSALSVAKESQQVMVAQASQADMISINNDNQMTCNECDLFVSPEHEQALEYAQGYYKLFMFAEAAHILQSILAEKPECNIARIYYGMSLMHLRNWNEAQRQFQLMTVLSDFPKWLALSYNALGCIHAIKLNLNQAILLFKKAYGLYPKFEDPLKNIQNCLESPHKLSLYLGSTELCYT